MDNETCQVTSEARSNGSSPAVTVPTVDDSNDVREERTTKKGRRKVSKGKNDENWRYCVQNCLHSGKSTNELIQCHLCQSWIHPEWIHHRRRERYCRHFDMHVMSAIAGASVALTRENVCPRVVD